MRRFESILQRVNSFANKQIKLKDRMHKPYNIDEVLLTGMEA